ncbi:hypothetical protein O6H91_12G014900 [Diphasiastrum complanatum]|nr:hypothetical protein O6H91_12G014900 [Diphasiastrum complanatum]
MAASTAHPTMPSFVSGSFSGQLLFCSHALLSGSFSAAGCLSSSFFAGNNSCSKYYGWISEKNVQNRSWAGRGVCTVQCVSRSWNPRAKDRSLLQEAEAGWQRIQDKPYDGLSFSLEDFERSIPKYDYSCDVGEMVKGRVFTTDARGAFVDIGAKAAAFLPLSEACMLGQNSMDEIGLFPGMEDEFMVVDEEDKEGRIIISLKQPQLDLAWERVRQMQAEDVTVRGTIQSANRGGVLVMVESLKGFLPFSLTTPGKEMEHWLGKELPLKFIEIDEEQPRLLVSNRKAIADSQAELGIGSVVIGTVQSLKPYGAFVDIGGVNGLLHISQVSNERITTLNNVLQVGDKLKVMILSQDKERGRISLSTKKLEPSPGDMLRNPALVFEKAEEMAISFRQRIAQAEAAARTDEARCQDDSIGMTLDFLNTAGRIGGNSSKSFSDRDGALYPV